MNKALEGPNDIVIISAVNDDNVLWSTLKLSPMIQRGVPLLVQKGFTCASKAYNHGLRQSGCTCVIFAHQDVYFPRDWIETLNRAIDALRDRKWAVLGIIGKDRNGRAWSTGIGQEVGRKVEGVVPVTTIDELVIVLNRKSGLQFDERLPGFHLYGTDIVQTAIQAGYETYIFDGPVIHNSLPVTRLDRSYWNAYQYMQKKWRKILPIDTLIVPITRFAWPVHKSRIKNMIRLGASRDQFRRLEDPAGKAHELGYE
jgi:hypothetical protein